MSFTCEVYPKGPYSFLAVIMDHRSDGGPAETIYVETHPTEKAAVDALNTEMDRLTKPVAAPSI